MPKDYDDITIDIVNKLFENLFSVCKAWKVSLGDERAIGDCKRQWLSAFKENNLTNIERIKKGMVKVRARTLPFLPSPGEFIALCRLDPIDIGAPSVEDAYEEAVKNSYPDGTKKRWTHPCVRRAYLRSGAFEIRTEPKSKTYPLFEKHYLDSFDDYAEGRMLNQVEHNQSEKQGRNAPVTGFGGYEWARPGAMKQYECIRNHADCMEVIKNMTILNPKMGVFKSYVEGLGR